MMTMPDEAEKWLMEHDELYIDRERNNKLEYPYLSYNQINKLNRIEKPTEMLNEILR